MTEMAWFKALLMDFLYDERTISLTDGEWRFYWSMYGLARKSREEELGTVSRLSLDVFAKQILRSPDWIRDGLAACIAAGLVEVLEDGALFLPDFASKQAAGSSTERTRKWRAKKKASGDASRERVTGDGHGNRHANRHGNQERREEKTTTEGAGTRLQALPGRKGKP